MILIIDNYDSFVYNLARYVRELGRECRVVRNDAITLDEIEALAPSHIIVSPGPRTPAEAGISNPVIERFGDRVPVLGVCLGHQCIGQVYGARIARAQQPMHGKASPIDHSGGGIFRGLPSPFQAGRYHSLIVHPTGLPEQLEVTACSPEGEIMGLQHRRFPVFGVQFHPESILTEHGYALLANFLEVT
jgi:anthranilate synthase/aminodeoxychorismate synthase-like glutamine amidotransferase